MPEGRAHDGTLTVADIDRFTDHARRHAILPRRLTDEEFAAEVRFCDLLGVSPPDREALYYVIKPKPVRAEYVALVRD